ncbi:MAG: N-acetylmuramoyl-L-alanine amidase [Bacteroidota bacterium]
MRLIYLFVAVLLFQFSLIGQNTERLTETLQFPREQAMVRINGVLPFVDQLPFFSYFIEWSGGPLPMKIRFATEADRWGEWQELRRDEHNIEKGITELGIGAPEFRFFQVQLDTRDARTQSAIIHFYQPGETKVVEVDSEAPQSSSSLACPCPQPTIQSRAEWCPTGDCPVQASPASTVVTHLIVHHSAGTNSANDWAAIVRAIWDLHVNGNGWDDIGYNYLVDPDGVLYEGRGNDIRGAHFCGTNTGTMGVCVLGNFTSIEPTSEAINSLERLLGWKACDIDADPLGTSFHASSGRNLMHISGHRDGCATACPGDSFYPLFSMVREGVNDLIVNECTAVDTEEPGFPEGALTIQPNPVQNVLQLQLQAEETGPIQIQILDANQRLLLASESQKYLASWEEQVDVASLPTGTYFLRVQLIDRRGVWRFVKH